MIVALFPNNTKKQSHDIAEKILEQLHGKGVTVVVNDQDKGSLAAPSLSTVDPKKIDYIICLGGDGTITRSCELPLWQ
jgi:NAD kinase